MPVLSVSLVVVTSVVVGICTAATAFVLVGNY